MARRYIEVWRDGCLFAAPRDRREALSSDSILSYDQKFSHHCKCCAHPLHVMTFARAHVAVSRVQLYTKSPRLWNACGR